MSGGNENSSPSTVPMSELGSLSVEDYADYCADLAEQVEDGKINWDQAADLMFGVEPVVTYVHWTAR